MKTQGMSFVKPGLKGQIIHADNEYKKKTVQMNPILTFNKEKGTVKKYTHPFS